jgi:hypothetical protein
MNISPGEAKDALSAIQQVTQKTRRSLAVSGAYIFLVVTGVVWMLGFLSTQYLSPTVTTWVWISSSLIGTVVAVYLGSRMGQRVRSPEVSVTARRAITFWVLLVAYCAAVIAVAQPLEGKQVTLLIILFTMIGQLAMGLLLSFSATWWALPITALALIGYFFFPSIFYVWMALLVGGGMIALGIYIRLRW